MLNKKINSNFATQFKNKILLEIERKMDTLSYKTKSANLDNIQKEWFLVDAEKEVLGRMATKVAAILRGKNKTNFTPHMDCGDNVIIINAEKIRLTGNKMNQKEYLTFSGYPGGQHSSLAKELLAKKPTALVEKAVKGMLPKNKLGSAVLKNLHVYAGTEHPHEAQKPQTLKLSSIK